MRMNKKHSKGFTLIEMLLVMVIIAGFIYMGAGYLQQRTLSLRIDRTSAQMQQILNAGLVYYSANSSWPTNLGTLQSGGYLPTSISSPWNAAYDVYSSGSLMYVSVKLPAAASSINIAKVIVGTLPLAFTAASPSATTYAACTAANCYVVASVTIPSQSISGAQAINFAGIYHSGSCVPAPTCPSGYTAQVFTVPVSVNAYFDEPDPISSPCSATDTTGCIMSSIQLSGFTAYATSDIASNYPTSKPFNCSKTATENCYTDYQNTTEVTSGNYWRVCLSVNTSSGVVTPTGSMANAWGQVTGAIMVMTRCMPSSQNSGSDFTVWMPDS